MASSQELFDDKASFDILLKIVDEEGEEDIVEEEKFDEKMENDGN